MDKSRRRPLAQFAVLAIVLGGHVLLVMLFSSTRLRDARTAQPSPETGPILLMDLAPLPPESPPEKEEARSSAGSSSRSPTPPSTARSIERPSPKSTPGTAIEAPPDTPRIDWQLEAQRSAQGIAPGLLKQQQRKCEAAGAEVLLPECKKKNYETHWEPEPKRGGIEGLLPYVRVGERCIVGLGFFGCALGKLPEANGHLLDDIGDPNRPTSSVPELEEALPSAPSIARPQAFKEE